MTAPTQPRDTEEETRFVLEQTVVVELASSLGGDDFGVRQICQGGDWLFMLVSFMKERMMCGVVAIDRETLTVGASRELGYIKHDNGGGTLRCTTSGSRVSLGQEFMIHIFDHGGGAFAEASFLETEQHTEAGWFWGDDHVLHFDEQAGGLVLTDFLTETTRLLGFEYADHYGLSPAGRFGACIGKRSEQNATELVIFSMPDLQVLGAWPMKDGREELIFHPHEESILTVRDGALLRIEVGGDGRTTEHVLQSEPQGRLMCYDSMGHRVFCDTGYYAFPSTPPKIEVWTAARDSLSVASVPVDGDTCWMLPDGALVLDLREANPAGAVRLSFVRPDSDG